MMVWRFSRDLYDRRGRGQDPLLGRTSEDSGAAPCVLAHPGESPWKTLSRECWDEQFGEGDFDKRLEEAKNSAVWEPHGLGLGPSQPEATLQAASRIAEAELLAAILGLDDPIAWLVENYPQAIREMPSQYLEKISAARDVLARYVAEDPYPGGPLASRKAP